MSHPRLLAWAADRPEYRAEIVRALFHRAPIRLAAEAFRFRGAGASYRTARARPLDWFRSDDGVTIRRVVAGEAEAAFDHVDQPGPGVARFEVKLENDDWVEYSIEVPTPSRLAIEVELGFRAPDRTTPLALTVDGQPVATTLGDGCVRAITASALPAGSHTLRVMALRPAVGIRALVVTPRRCTC